MKKTSMITLACTLVLAATIGVQAQPRMERGMRLIGELNLTAEQQKTFDKLRTDHQKSMIDNRAGQAKARVEMRDLLKAETPDRGAIERKMKEIADLRVKAGTGRLDQWFAVNKMLNADQQKVWKKVLGARQSAERGAPRMGRRMGRMQGEMPMHDGPGIQRRERMYRD